MSHQPTIIIYRKRCTRFAGWSRMRQRRRGPEGGDFCRSHGRRTRLSIVCEEEMVPNEAHCERHRRLMQIEGTLAFTLTGVLASAGDHCWPRRS